MNELLSTRLRDLKSAVGNGSTSALADFWKEIEQHGAPLIESAAEGQYHVTFLWRDAGETRSVDVIQDWGADGIREHHMTRLPGTDVWYKTRLMPSDTRTTYQIAPDPLPAAFAGGVPFIPDPLNPNKFRVYFDENFTIWFSLLALPDVPAQTWLTANVPVGTVTVHTPFEDGRRIWIYTPAVETSSYALLVAFDGRTAVDMVNVPKMLDVQIAAGKIAPTIAVFIDNPDRRELTCNPEFAEYVARQIMPWVHTRFRVAQDAAKTVISGASYGGLCAAYVALNYPDIFGAVLAQTGWFRWQPDNETEHAWLARQVIALPLQPVRFYLDVGSLETARMLDRGPSQLAANRHMRVCCGQKATRSFIGNTAAGMITAAHRLRCLMPCR